VEHQVIDLITCINGAAQTVVGDRRSTGATTYTRGAGLDPITEQRVITRHIAWSVLNYILHLVAGVDCARDTVIGNGRCARLTIGGRIADLNPVTEHTVGAVGVVRGMDHGIQ
jgi:hypothetical protein